MAHDWGGAVAWSTAQAYPHMVDRLAVFAAPPLALFKANMSLEQNMRSWYMLLFLVSVCDRTAFC